MKLIRTATEPAPTQKKDSTGSAIDRRTFLKRSGITLGGAAAAAALSPTMMRKAQAAIPSGGDGTQTIRTVCTHCSVGCGINAEARSQLLTTHLTWARIAQKVLRSANMAMASAA